MSVESFTPTDAADARRAPGVAVAPVLPMKLVEPVSKLEATTPMTPGSAWGVEAVGALESGFSGAGVRVAVLDTGIDAGHEAFRGLRVTQRDFTGEGDVDRIGHGTHCAGIIAGRDVNGYRYGVAPGVDELLVAKVVGADGGSTDALMKAMLWALESGAHVMSMSLGLDFPGLVARWTDNGLALQAATSRALEGYRDSLRLFGRLADVIRAAPLRQLALVIAATGNESQRGAAVPYTIGVAPPAASEGFVAVGALRRTPRRGVGRGGVLQRRRVRRRPGRGHPFREGGGRFHRHERDEHGYSARRPASRPSGQRVCWPPRNASISACCSRVSPETARSCPESPQSMRVPDWCARRSRERSRPSRHGSARDVPRIR